MLSKYRCVCIYIYMNIPSVASRERASEDIDNQKDRTSWRTCVRRTREWLQFSSGFALVARVFESMNQLNKQSKSKIGDWRLKIEKP